MFKIQQIYIYCISLICLLACCTIFGAENIQKTMTNKNAVGVIAITDIDTISSWQMSKALLELFQDPATKGILLAIDSFGGSSSITYSIFSQIQKLKKVFNKPVVAYIENQAFSGGYYIACAADYIVASEGASVGSIGVRLALIDRSQYDQHKKVSYTMVRTGRYLDQFAVHSNRDHMHQDIKKRLLKSVDTIYNKFIADVLAARPSAIRYKSKWAEAQLLDAQKAYQYNLVDELGTQVQAFKYIYNYSAKNKRTKYRPDMLEPKYITIPTCSHDFVYDIMLN